MIDVACSFDTRVMDKVQEKIEHYQSSNNLELQKCVCCLDCDSADFGTKGKHLKTSVGR